MSDYPLTDSIEFEVCTTELSETTFNEGETRYYRKVEVDPLLADLRAKLAEAELKLSNEKASHQITLVSACNRANENNELRAERDALRVENDKLKAYLEVDGEALKGKADKITSLLAEVADLKRIRVALIAQRDELKMGGIHSCWHECPRPLCVAIRERDAAQRTVAEFAETNVEVNNKWLEEYQRRQSAESQLAALRSIVDCACNALTDSILVSGNDARTNMHWVRKLAAALVTAGKASPASRTEQ